MKKKIPTEIIKLINNFVKNMDIIRKNIRTIKRLISGDVSVIAAN